MEDQLQHFKENGYVVLHEVLLPDEIARVNDGMAADEEANPEKWVMRPRPGFDAIGNDAPELMHRTDALDGIIHHPSAISLVIAILGEGAQCSGLTFMRRYPCLVDPPEDIDGGDSLALSRQWHREDSGCVEGADKNEFFTPSIQIIYYLDDVDEGTHCTSVIPESAETKRRLSKTTQGGLRIFDADTSYIDPDKPTWSDAFGREFPRRIGRVDVHAKAGSGLVFNNASWHCATIRKTDRVRRAVHVRYRQPEPVRSRHGLKSPFKSVAEFQAALPKLTSM